MSGKTKKAQVVIAAIDKASQAQEFLLLQTNERRGSFWQNVTGKVEDKETYEEGALREAIEETGLRIEGIQEILNLGLCYEFTDQHKRKVVEETFLIIMDEKWEVKIDPSEHRDFKWVPIDEIFDGIVKYSSNYEVLSRANKLMKLWGV